LYDRVDVWWQGSTADVCRLEYGEAHATSREYQCIQSLSDKLAAMAPEAAHGCADRKRHC